MDQPLKKAVMRVFNGDLKLDEKQLTLLFLKQLDNIYVIKIYLLKTLPEIAEKATFYDLKTAITACVDKVEMQVLRMKVVYNLFDTSFKADGNNHVKTLSLKDYLAGAAKEQSPVEKDIDLLIYLQIIESIEISYFSVLRNIAEALKKEDVLALISQNFVAATDSKKLFELIAKEYIQ